MQTATFYSRAGIWMELRAIIVDESKGIEMPEDTFSIFFQRISVCLLNFVDSLSPFLVSCIFVEMSFFCECRSSVDEIFLANCESLSQIFWAPMAEFPYYFKTLNENICLQIFIQLLQIRRWAKRQCKSACLRRECLCEMINVTSVFMSSTNAKWLNSVYFSVLFLICGRFTRFVIGDLSSIRNQLEFASKFWNLTDNAPL